MSSLTFLGAAGTVTGSKHLLEIDGHRILVDCGLFQGLKELRQRNWEPLPVDAASITAVVLTHAHLDHCGWLPRLVSAGFPGRIFCTPATKELTGLVLTDSARIQEEDARDANRNAYTKHNPALPLYTQIDAARAIDRLQPVGYERPIPLWPASNGRDAPTVEFINAGHLLGSAYARIRLGSRSVLFGGDLGRYSRPVLPDPLPVSEADYLLLESTYGDRLHPRDDDGEHLAQIVRDTAQRGGKLVVPSFAIGRVEELLYWLKRLEDEKRIPVQSVYVDSPMAIAALRYYSKRLNELDADLDPAVQPALSGVEGPALSGVVEGPAPSGVEGPALSGVEGPALSGVEGPALSGVEGPALSGVEGSEVERSPDRSRRVNPEPSRKGARQVAAFATDRLVLVASPQQSADLVASRQPAIVIASSGMATGGRVLRHLAAALPNAKNTVLFAGFQADGTRGRQLVEGAKEIRMLGRAIPVAARIEHLESMSAHADAGEIMRWLSGFSRPPQTVFLVHGEPAGLQALAARITAERNWPVHIAAHRETVTLAV